MIHTPFHDPSAYECGRPDYAPEAVEWLTRVAAIEAGSVVADIGAGTGKLGAALPHHARVIAIEPDTSMRSVLRRRHAHLTVLAGNAEALPLRDASVNAVVSAQALHLFRQAAAAGEFLRVLKRGGVFVHVWRRRVHDEVHDRIAELVEPLRGAMPSLGAGLAAWRARNEFRVVASARFPYSTYLSRDDLVRRSLSTPYVTAVTAERRAGLEERLRTLAAEFPEPVRLDFHTEVYVESPAA